MNNDAWDYFREDRHYSDVLKNRLADGVEMDSAKALAAYLEQTCDGDLYVVDVGSGPGHYFPVLKRRYTRGGLRYLGIDIDADNVEYGSRYFSEEPSVELRVGSVLAPEPSIPDDVNCVISANTLPHIPTIEPLLRLLAARRGVRYFIFRMLIGSECVQIKKHLRELDFDEMFTRNFQLNNIYSLSYLQHYLGSGWQIDVADDVFDAGRLDQHRLPAQDADAFYGNRVSRSIGSMIFKGEVYMPWKFVIGRRTLPGTGA